MSDRPLRSILDSPHCAVGLVGVLVSGPAAAEAIEDLDHGDARLEGPVKGAGVVGDGRLGEGGGLGPGADRDASAVAVDDRCASAMVRQLRPPVRVAPEAKTCFGSRPEAERGQIVERSGDDLHAGRHPVARAT